MSLLEYFLLLFKLVHPLLQFSSLVCGLFHHLVLLYQCVTVSDEVLKYWFFLSLQREQSHDVPLGVLFITNC